MAFLWDQQDEESAKAFAAFVAYRSLPAQQRSIDTAWKRSVATDPEATPPKPGQRAPATWRDWSAQFSWVSRAAAWDAEKDRQAQQAQIDEHKAMLERHVTLGQGLIAKAAAALNGMPVTGLEAKDVASWIRVGTELERKSRLLPDQIVEHRGQVTANHEGTLTHSVEHSVDTTYDALVELLLNGPADAIKSADRLSGRLAADSSVLGRACDETPGGAGPVEESPAP